MSEHADIRARLDAATPGPWRCGINHWAIPIPCVTCGPEDSPLLVAEIGVIENECATHAAENAALIAHAPADLDRLLRENEALRERVEQAEVDTERRVDSELRERLEAALAETTRLLKEVDALVATLYRCSEIAGADLSGTPRDWTGWTPDYAATRAIDAVTNLRTDYDEALAGADGGE